MGVVLEENTKKAAIRCEKTAKEEKKTTLRTVKENKTMKTIAKETETPTTMTNKVLQEFGSPT